MHSQRHVIKRQVIEVSAPTSTCNPVFQDEISRLVREQLTESIGEVCDSLADADTIYRIDLLEIHVGRIPVSQLESALVPAITAAFRVHLEEAIRKNDAGASSSRVRSSVEVVELRATTGVFPWWVEPGRAGRLEAALALLIAEAPEELFRLLGRLALEANALRRLVLALDDVELEKLMRLRVAERDAGLMKGMRLLPDRLSEARLGPGLSRERLRAVVWQAGLRWVAQNRDEGGAMGDAVLSVLTRVAEALGTTVDVVQKVLDGGNEGVSEAWQGEWREAVGTLERESKAVEQGERDELTKRLLALGAWYGPVILALGPGWRRAGGSLTVDGLRTLRRLSDEGLGTAGEEELLLTAIARLRRTDGVDEATLSGLLDCGSEAFRAGVRKILAEPATEPRPKARSEGGFSDAEEVYLGNAGLVILAPFLERFFSHRGLCVKGEFVDEAARHRAAGLLQHLVTEAEMPEEASISLNKVLCGIDPGEVFEFEGPVTPEEREESVKLLTAVIEHAPILHRMSLRGFRGSFLLRAGQLSVREDRWLVRVERETYDVVLDQFPWTFRWIRLPWMKAPLEVEW